MIKKIVKNAVVKNAGWLILEKVAQMGISLIVGVLTARYLGPSNYGLINYASAYTAFFMAFCTLGINSILVKEFVDNPEDEGKIIGSTLVMRAISSFMSAVVIVCLVSIIDADEMTTITVTALCSLGLIFHIFETFNYWFQAKLKSKIVAIVSLVAYIITAAYRIILLFFGKGVEWFAFSTALDYICVGAMLLICYKINGGAKLSFSKEISRNLLKKSTHFILPSLMVAIYGYTDKLMLKQMLNETEVGYYATATAICSMWCFVLKAIIDSIYPSVMEANKSNHVLFLKRNRQLYAIVFYIAVAVSIFFCVFGKQVIWILYGEQYIPATNPLKIVTWYTAFSYLGVARNAWIVCENKQNYLKYIYILSAVCNVLMNFVLIPLCGTLGAAFATLITQIITVLVIPFFIKPLRENSVLMIEGIMLKDIK